MLRRVPQGLLDLPGHALAGALSGPTLIELDGLREPALFVSVLVHGDEVGGWDAVRAWLRTLVGTELGRSLRLFIGNPRAAARSRRHLDDQPDFNRVWRGEQDHPLARAARAVTERMRTQGCFAGVDIHNNSGVNPCHVCVAELDWYTLRVASLFAQVIVHVDHPNSIQTAAFAEFCPAVTLEAGRVGDADGIRRSMRLLETLTSINSLDEIEVGDGSGVSLYRTLARVEIASNSSFGFTGAQASPCTDITLRAELESHNFSRLGQGTVFGEVGAGEHAAPLLISSRQGELDVDAFFEVHGQVVRLGRDLTFSMFTTNPVSIRQDCLCYLMEPIALQPVRESSDHVANV